MQAGNFRKVRLAEGDHFAVPLREQGYANGVIARLSPKGGVVLAYFFGPRTVTLPDESLARAARPEDAVMVARVGDLGLYRGEWPIIYRHSAWDREKWPMPRFVRRDAVSGDLRLIDYDDNDPATEIGLQIGQPEDARSFPDSALLGAGFVEITLTQLLSVR
jgi:hypothetical protein